MNNPEPATLVLGALGVLIPVVLLGGTSVAAWRRLARTFPDSPVAPERTYRGISGQIGGTYGAVEGCLRVGLSRGGLRISMWPRFLWPPFTIPWPAITSCERARYYFSPAGIRIAIAGWPAPIHLWPRLWRHEKLPDEIQSLWNEHARKAA